MLVKDHRYDAELQVDEMKRKKRRLESLQGIGKEDAAKIGPISGLYSSILFIWTIKTYLLKATAYLDARVKIVGDQHYSYVASRWKG